MVDYKFKYLKYKLKYEKLLGGVNSDIDVLNRNVAIINFFENCKNSEYKNMEKYDEYCENKKTSFKDCVLEELNDVKLFDTGHDTKGAITQCQKKNNDSYLLGRGQVIKTQDDAKKKLKELRERGRKIRGEQLK